MAKFKNVNSKIQVVGSKGDDSISNKSFDDNIKFYNKNDSNGVTQLGFSADSGDVVLSSVDLNGNEIQTLERFCYSQVTFPVSTSLEGLIDKLNSYLDPSSSIGDPFEITLAVTDEISNISTGTSKITFRMPIDMTLTDVRSSVNTAPVGSDIQVDINIDGSSVLSTILSIDDGTETSVGSASPAVISNNSLTIDSEITIDIDQIGSTTAGKGLKLILIGERA